MAALSAARNGQRNAARLLWRGLVEQAQAPVSSSRLERSAAIVLNHLTQSHANALRFKYLRPGEPCTAQAAWLFLAIASSRREHGNQDCFLALLRLAGGCCAGICWTGWGAGAT